MTEPAYIEAPLPPNEAERLLALRRMEILDTPPEANFERIVRLAAGRFQVPMALISLVDEHRQWFKARVGLDAAETPRGLAFCAHAILGADVCLVPDALLDRRFAGNPLVAGHPDIRFYAGAPLIDRNGFRLGTLCIIDTRPRPSFDEGTALQDFASIVIDEMELRLLNSRLARAKEEAEEANRAKSTFLARISHEIRTPMNGILGFADLVLSSDVTPEQRRNLGFLKESAESLLVIINDILDISKIEAGQIEMEHIPLSPAEIAKSAVGTVSVAARAKGVELVSDLSADLPTWIEGDPTRLRQILLNLLTNAIKFTGKGRVTLRGSRDPAAPRERLRLEVADTGIGIPEDVRGRLFQNFAQADETITRRFGGTGLGLAICKSLVAAMGGEIGVQSKAGEGSRFWFTIALKEVKAPDYIEAPAAPVVAEGSGGARILVADDVKINRTLVELILKAGGHSVTLAANGMEALDMIKREAFDLVLMDMEMPEMDGLTATRTIRAMEGKVRNLPIIALTANAMTEQAAQCRAAGMDDYIAKPIDRGTLLAKVAAWTGRRSEA